jgi:signal transduction histidine kinase
MNEIENLTDKELLNEIDRRFSEKSASLNELEFLNKKLVDLNKRLVEMDSVKSRFLSLVKNEFNNPISSVLNLCGHLISKKRPERFDEIVAMMHMEVLRLDFQIKNIISASEIEAGETKNYYARVDFNDIFEEAKTSMRYVIQDKELKMSFKDESGGSVCSDGQKIYLIFLNLLSNACEYSYRSGLVEAKVSLDDNDVVITFEDTGEGIIADSKLSVYNRFTQFSRGINRAQTGLGLGLSVVKGMAEALDGTVDYESEPEKKTIFTVRFPQADSAKSCGVNSGGSNDTLFEDFDDAVEM